MARVFVTRHLPGTALERLGAEHEVDLWPRRLPPGPDDLRAHAARAEGLLSMLTDPVNAELLGRLPAAARHLELCGGRGQHRPR